MSTHNLYSCEDINQFIPELYIIPTLIRLLVYITPLMTLILPAVHQLVPKLVHASFTRSISSN